MGGAGCCCCSGFHSLQLHGLQHARLPCPALSPRVCSNCVYGVGDAIQPSHPLSSPSPPAFNLPRIRVFSNESALRIRWPKYWSFSFSINPSNEHSGLISFRIGLIVTNVGRRPPRPLMMTEPLGTEVRGTCRLDASHSVPERYKEPGIKGRSSLCIPCALPTPPPRS